MTVSPDLQFDQDLPTRVPRPVRNVRPDWAVRHEAKAFNEVVKFAGIDLKIEADRERREAETERLDDLYRKMLEGVTLNSDESIELAGAIAVAAGRKAPVATRGVVVGMSEKSRMRLMQGMGAIDVRGRFCMITLTYPGEWQRTADGSWRLPAVVRNELQLWRHRIEYRWGKQPFVWKFETQKRGAPHFHLGMILPDVPEAWGRKARKTVHRIFLEDCREQWHELIVHGGSRCLVSSLRRRGELDVTKLAASGMACLDHLDFGCHADLGFAERVQNGASTLASYFAKHGLWRSKDYQHVTPGRVLRAALEAGDVPVTVPGPMLPVSEWVDTSQKRGAKPEIVTTWYPTEIPNPDLAMELWFAEQWETPGRWWGIRRFERPERLVVDDVDADMVHVVRLLARKCYKRRTTRLVANVTSAGELQECYVSRPLMSLYGDRDRGFWIMAKDGAAWLRWALGIAKDLCWLKGVELAKALSLVVLPATEPQRAIRNGRRRRSGTLRNQVAEQQHPELLLDDGLPDDVGEFLLSGSTAGADKVLHGGPEDLADLGFPAQLSLQLTASA